MLSISSLWTLAFMSLPEFFYERVTSEIHQQMEGVLALAERLARQPMGADAQACVAGVTEAARAVGQILMSSSDLKAAAMPVPSLLGSARFFITAISPSTAPTMPRVGA